MRSTGRRPDRIPQDGATLVTFDSCVFGLVNGEKLGEFDAAAQLVRLATEGQVAIQLTTPFDRDLCRNSDSGRHSVTLAWLMDAAVLLHRAGGLFRLDAGPSTVPTSWPTNRISPSRRTLDEF